MSRKIRFIPATPLSFDDITGSSFGLKKLKQGGSFAATAPASYSLVQSATALRPIPTSSLRRWKREHIHQVADGRTILWHVWTICRRDRIGQVVATARRDCSDPPVSFDEFVE